MFKFLKIILFNDLNSRCVFWFIQYCHMLYAFIICTHMFTLFGKKWFGC